MENRSNDRDNKQRPSGKCVQCAIMLAILEALDVDVKTPLSCDSAPQASEIDELLTRKEVMYKLNIKESTYSRWIERGILVPRKMGKRHFYTEADLERAFRESVRKGKR